MREGKPQDGKIIDQRTYREIVGSLMYLVNGTRPDLSYAVNVLSRHQLNPTDHEWKMIIRVFRYLEYSKNWTLTYKSQTSGMEPYCNASFADCKNSLTTSGNASASLRRHNLVENA